MAFATVENNRLRFIATEQGKIRGDLYNNIVDAVHLHDTQTVNQTVPVGQHVILPPSFLGSPRDMHRRFLDAMAIVRKFHKPDIFLTYTCNTEWPEIKEHLLPGQEAKDRPDLCARVFNAKLCAYILNITKGKLFGKCSARLAVIEFQKRGLPHAHILLILYGDDRIASADAVDRVVCAELPVDPANFEEGTPERSQAERLQTLVMEKMVHGPCGITYPNAPCMKDSKCSKKFPKSFQSQTVWDETQTYPLYKRRSPDDGGREIITANRTINNGWIVPYNPYTLLSQEAHINVEICCSTLSVKYLYKYTVFHFHIFILETVS